MQSDNMIVLCFHKQLMYSQAHTAISKASISHTHNYYSVYPVQKSKFQEAKLSTFNGPLLRPLKYA